MPLKKIRKWATKKQREKVASKNISIEIRAGKPRKQAIAIWLSSAWLSKRKKLTKRKRK